MDHRISYRIVLDTETCPCDKDFKGVSAWNMFVYDCGWAVVDKRGKVYRTRSFVNADIFLDEKSLMKSAYYAKKIPIYRKQIATGERILTSFYNIRKTLMDDIKEFEVSEIYAHNARFDYGSLTNTQRWETKSKYRYFFPKNVTICDTLRMSRQVIATMPNYQKFCKRNGYLTKTGKPQLKAETIYRYITGNTDFSESHTGLEDVMIEKEIMAYCFRKHKKMERRLWTDNQPTTEKTDNSSVIVGEKGKDLIYRINFKKKWVFVSDTLKNQKNRKRTVTKEEEQRLIKFAQEGFLIRH